MAKKKEKIKLTRAEKKQLQELMTRSQQQSGKKGPRTAQDTIPYQRMWPDGICRVTDNYYTKTIQFQDINYQLAQNDDKTSIFEGWCDFLNYFDASIHLQFSFLNLTASAESFEQSIIIPDKDDGFNDVRHEYAEMLQNQLAKGNNGLTKTKFITYGIEAENFKAAKPRLERIEIDLLNNFKRLGVAASPLDGRERLKLIRMNEKKFAVMLTDTQEIKTLECDPQEELFEIARGTIGCEWIELVEAEPLAQKGYLMLIDEEGKLKKGPVSINCLASDLYGADRHGDAIVGNVMVVRAEDERLTLLTKEEATVLAAGLEAKRDLAVEKISAAFGLKPIVKPELEIVDLSRRQSCRKNSMER